MCQKNVRLNHLQECSRRQPYRLIDKDRAESDLSQILHKD